MPFKVEVQGLVRVGNRMVKTPFVTVPGIGVAVAYVTGDAMGTIFTFDVPSSGIIHTAVMLDKDDEGIETDLVLFTAPFDPTTDNSAFAVTDADMQAFLTTITFATFKNFSVNQVSTAAALGIAYVAPERKLYAQVVTRGGPTIAAGNEPMFSLTIISDE